MDKEWSRVLLTLLMNSSQRCECQYHGAIRRMPNQEAESTQQPLRGGGSDILQLINQHAVNLCELRDGDVCFRRNEIIQKGLEKGVIHQEGF